MMHFSPATHGMCTPCLCCSWAQWSCGTSCCVTAQIADATGTNCQHGNLSSQGKRVSSETLFHAKTVLVCQQLFGDADWESYFQGCRHVTAASQLLGADLQEVAAGLPHELALQRLPSMAQVVQHGQVFVVSGQDSTDADADVVLSFATATERVGIIAVHGRGYTCCKCSTQPASPCQHVKALCLWLVQQPDQAPPVLQGAMSDLSSATFTRPEATSTTGPVSTSRIPYLVATEAERRRSEGGECALLCIHPF